jgi:hypothetical protein
MTAGKSSNHTGTQKRQVEPQRDGPIAPLDWRKILPFEPAAASQRLGWVGLEAARCRAEPAFERNLPALKGNVRFLYCSAGLAA